MKYKLSELAFYSTEKIEIDKVDESNYVSTENILPNKAGTCIADKLPQIKKVNAYKNGDILISNIRPYFKKIWFANKDGGHSADVLNFRAKEGVSNRFLYALLFQDSFFNQMVLSSKGTKMPRGDKNAIMNLEFEVPSYNKQEKISDILFYFQDKIELNNQIISNLEELASTLFKRWFVDFEFPDENGNPYKSSGGKMVDSELGEIPEGWEITELKSIVDVVDNRGKTPPLEKDKTDFPIIDVKTLSGNGRVVNYNKAQKYVSEETYSSWFRSGHPKINDILISTVGSIGEIKMFLTDKGTIAQNVVGLRAKKHLEYHLYQFLLYNKSNLITYNIGSVQPSIKVTHLLKHKVLLPNKKDLNKFNSVMIGLTDKIINLSKEINSLTEIRDSLLPKLLSGEVELPEDEEV